MIKNNFFGLLIKTNQYTGNFERELCAHVTGHISEDEVGKEFVVPEVKSLFDGCITSQFDSYGCECIVTVGTEFEFSNLNDLVIFFSTAPTFQQLSVIKNLLKTFNHPILNPKELIINSIEVVEFKTTYSIYNIPLEEL